MGGIDKVFVNLCLGLDRLGLRYAVNLPFDQLQDDDCVGVLGRGRYSLDGFDRSNPIVAGIGLMTHPSEWPTLCEDYPVARYLQHSDWTNNIYKPYFGERCAVWPVGIDTETWRPSGEAKDLDILVYDKLLWDREGGESTLIEPCLKLLSDRGLSVVRLVYGTYEESTYRSLVRRSRSMLFFSAHESQGIAYQECLSCDVPVLAWDQGWYLDPNRFQWGTPEIRASSVPYFDSRCGETFRSAHDFEPQLERFLVRLGKQDFRPREYILENLGLERCSRRFLEFFSPRNPIGSQRSPGEHIWKGPIR
jgi:hypothetical protein